MPQPTSFKIKKAVLALLATACFSFAALAWADDDDDDSSLDSGSIPGPVVEYKKGFANRSGPYVQFQGLYGLASKIEEVPLKDEALHHCKGRGACDHQKPPAGYKSATETYKVSPYAGRLSMGYDLGKLLSVEVGGFINPAQKSTLTNLTLFGKPENNPSSTKDKDIDVVSSFGVDLVGKLRIPLSSAFYVFVGGGGVWTYYRYTNKDTNSEYLTDHDGVVDQHWSSIAPEGVAGIVYAFSSHIALSTQYTHVFGKYKLTDVIADAIAKNHKTMVGAMPQNILSVSVMYKF